MGKAANYLKNKIPKAMHCKQAFVLSLPKGARVLDVGCGNCSPETVKRWRKDLNYTGIDVSDYNNTAKTLAYADEYIVSTPLKFSKSIREIDGMFDAVISSHNLEHCNNQTDTMTAMCCKLKKGGRLYLAFPCEESIAFPHRRGTLNFYDDSTHKEAPEYEKILKLLCDNGMKILFSRKQYKPLYYWVWGGDF